MTRNTARPVPTSPGAQALAQSETEHGQALALPEDLTWATEHHSEYTSDDIAVPFIRIIQSLSPQIDPQAPEFIDGAKVGMLFNTATGETFEAVEEGIRFIPVKFAHDVTEWKPRDQGGGLVARHGTDLSQLKRLGPPDSGGKRYTMEGTEIQDAALYFGLLHRDNGTLEQCVVLMSSSGWKAARQWNTRQKLLQVRDSKGNAVADPAPFLAAWRLRTVYVADDKGKYYTWAVPEFACFTTRVAELAPQVWDVIRSMVEGLKAGTIKAASDIEGSVVDESDVHF